MTVLLSARGLTKSYGSRLLFKDLTFDLCNGEQVGLIGPNGAGKTTLLRILAEMEDLDAGECAKRRGSRIGYVAQDDVFPAGQTVRQAILSVLADEPIEEHERDTRTAIILTQVGFESHDQSVDVLSGGWRKRLALAQQLVLEPDLLLLDEPTNHLDLPGILWLEQLLRGSSFGFLLTSHDRAFLRAVAKDVMEINRVYPTGYFRTSGSYEEFIQRRADFLEAQARQQESVANQVRRDTEWLGRQAEARTSKARYRIEGAVRKREELADLKSRTAKAGTANLDFVATERKSRKLLTAEGLSKTLGDRKLFSGLDLLLSPGTKLGLLGANGSGKSSLLRVISGELEADTGTITRAENLLTVTFEQGRAALDQSITLKEALCPIGDHVKFRDQSLHVMAWAKQFLFRAEQLPLQVSELSGGEQARVRIAQLMTKPADLLLLDEPTNDLDIPALEVLEESLMEFPGALIVVSHDRDLLDRLCTEVIGLDGRGNASIYASVDQWLSAYEQVHTEEQKLSKAKEKAKASPPRRERSSRAAKLSFHEKKELAGMEDAIAEAEVEVSRCETAVAEAASDHVALAEACRALEEAQQRVETLYARWEELEQKES